MSFRKRNISQQPAAADDSRRSFFLKMGAGVTGALASTAALAGVGAGDDTVSSSLKVAQLEDEKALRKLHQSFEQALDKGLYDEVVGMFSADAEVVFNGGIFRNRSRGLSRLYRERFKAGKTGKRMEPAPGFELDADRQQDSVEVSADRLSAQAEFPYSIQVGRPVESENSLASMARLHGEGVQTWWEGGVYVLTYARDVVDAGWKISRLEYKTLARADYRSGRSHAQPIAVAPVAARYPEDPQGPDALV